MDKKTPKLNTLFLYGGSNAGKSKVARSIVDGMLVIDQTTRSDTFLFQDLPGAQVCLMEELRIVQETVDAIKRLFEGAKMKVDIKNKDPRLFVLELTEVIKQPHVVWNRQKHTNMIFKKTFYFKKCNNNINLHNLLFYFKKL